MLAKLQLDTDDFSFSLSEVPFDIDNEDTWAEGLIPVAKLFYNFVENLVEKELIDSAELENLKTKEYTKKLFQATDYPAIANNRSGLAIRYGGAMDGIEVMAVIFAKRAGVTVGTFVMVYNIILYIICGCVLQSWVLPLYSIVAYSAALKTVDFIVEGIDRARQSKVCNYCDRVAT